MTIHEAFQIALQHHQAGRLAEAEALYRQILAVDPRHTDSLHLLGVAAHQVGRNDVAVGLIRQAAGLNPNNAEIHFNLGMALQTQGQFDEAIAAYRRACQIEPAAAKHHCNLGYVLWNVGLMDEAIAESRLAIQYAPDFVEAHNNLGNALREKGQFDEAIAAYLQALKFRPNLAEIHNNLGNALRDKGRSAEAIAAYRSALELKPDYAEASTNLSNALADQGHIEEAVSILGKLLQLKPDSAEAHHSLGCALVDQGLAGEAIAAYRRALELKPDFALALSNLGNALRGNGQIDEAVASLRRSLQLKPDLAVFHHNLSFALKDRAQLEEATESCRRAVALKPEDAALHSNLILTSLYQQRPDDAALGEEGMHWEHRHAAPLRKFVLHHQNQSDPGRRLKVGYVSPHFHICAVPNFVIPLLEAHDHAGFEIYCYASVQRPDRMTARVRKSADVWRDVFGMRDEALAAQIREDGIDILVDLAMHSGYNRLLVFARQPAPVQVAWVGHPGSTGVRAMDYRLTDAFMDPEGAAWSESVEEVVRLPDSWFCYDPLEPVPEPSELPALKAGGVTFGCLNDFCKVNEAVLERWVGVLAAVAGSRLFLRCPEGESRGRVLGFLQSHGIGGQRVEFAPRSLPRSEYLRLFDRMDIALDPFPYNGGTTTAEALWMGVPVLTLPGKMATSRLGLSILSACGMPEFVAHTEEEYVRLAASLAADLPRLAQLRATLRGRMKASAFMDGPRFAKNVEHAYRAMWRAWCAKKTAPVS